MVGKPHDRRQQERSATQPHSNRRRGLSGRRVAIVKPMIGNIRVGRGVDHSKGPLPAGKTPPVACLTICRPATPPPSPPWRLPGGSCPFRLPGGSFLTWACASMPGEWRRGPCTPGSGSQLLTKTHNTHTHTGQARDTYLPVESGS